MTEKVSIFFYTTKDIRKKLRLQAIENNMNISQYMNYLICKKTDIKNKNKECGQ